MATALEVSVAEVGVQVIPREPSTGNIGNCGVICPQGSPGSLGTGGLLACSEGSCASVAPGALRAQVGEVGPPVRPEVAGIGGGAGRFARKNGFPENDFPYNTLNFTNFRCSN